MPIISEVVSASTAAALAFNISVRRLAIKLAGLPD